MDEQAVCEFCGQVLLDRQACGCAGARKWHDEELRIRDACGELMDVLNTPLVSAMEEAACEKLTTLLCEFIPMMLRDSVTSVTVTDDCIGKITIRFDGKSWKIRKQKGVSTERKV